MSGQESESVSERELADYFASEGLLSGQPRSVGEALTAAEEQAPTEPPETPPVPEPPPVVVDEPVQPTEPDEEEVPAAPEQSPIEEEEAPSGEEEEEGLTVEAESDDVAWAKKRYGDDPERWAKGARDQDRHISKLTKENVELRELAQGWYQEAQSAQAAASQQQQAAMPLSAQEEAWIEQAMVNPLEYARTAAFNGNLNLFNGILERVAEENAMLAANIGAQVQMDMRNVADAQMAEQYQQNGQQPSLQEALGSAFQRLGIDLGAVGPTMMAKVEELGQYHPYVLAMMGPDDAQRDLAIQAVYDLVRSGTLTKRVVRDEQKAEQIRREGELRREAAGVVTGSPHVAPQAQDPFMAAMEQEWKDRGQWTED